MNFLTVENWLVLFIMLVAMAVAGYFVAVFLRLPNKQQLAQLREWLLWAVTEAEKELGGGTGKLKLRYVYDMFIVRFEFLSRFISFEAFSLLVDEVLNEFREMLETNTSIANYVENKINN